MADFESFKYHPDGRVMCCHCFEYKDRADLFTDENGDTWDVCKDCEEADRLSVQRRNNAEVSDAT